MGLYLRAGLLVKFVGFLIISILGLTFCSIPLALAQNDNSNSANIKAPKNLKKSAKNKSDTTNKDDNTDEKDKEKVSGNSADTASDKKDEKSEENKSNATSNGTPFGAWIPRDRVLWEHPDSNNAANIKQSSNAAKPKVVPVEKAKTSSVAPANKTNKVQSSNSSNANKTKATRTPSKLSKSKAGSAVKTTHKYSGNKSSKTITSTKSQSEDLITQEEPIDSSITESEGGNLPEDKTNIDNVDKNQQPLDKSEGNGVSSNQVSSTIVPESTQTNENVISEPPTENFDSSTLDGSKEKSKVESSSEPGINETTALEDDVSSNNNSKTDSNKITANNLKDTLKGIGYLLIVLALITLLWWISKFLMGFRDGSGFSQKTKLLHQMDLGMNQKLKLVQSGNMVLVLGVSPTGVQLFDKFPIEELDSHDWSSAVSSKTGVTHGDIHIAPSEAPPKPRVSTKPNIDTTHTTLRNAAGAYSDAANANAKGKSFTFRGGRLIERNEITDHTISQTPAQEKLISQIRSKVKQWDL